MTDQENKRLATARQALEILEKSGFSAYLAGGCVRDRLLGAVPKDYDIATNALPNQVKDIFQKKKEKVIPTGLDHGTVTLVTRYGPIEITTFRRDALTDGRHASVDFNDCSVKEDAARRDFTINALYEDRQGNILDFFEGKRHLFEKRLLFVGKPEERIREDYLRILRCYRFWAQLDFSPDESALRAIAKEKDGLKKISQERITNEFLQFLLNLKNPIPLKSMINTGVMPIILPEISWEQRNCRTQMVLSCPDLGEKFLKIGKLMLLLLCNPSGQNIIYKNIGQRMKLPGLDIKRMEFFSKALTCLPEDNADSSEIFEYVDEAEKFGGKGSFLGLFAPIIREFFKQETKYSSNIERLKIVENREMAHGFLRVAPLPISGDDLKQIFGLKEGPELGLLMKEVKKSYRNSLWKSKEEGLAFIRKSLLL